MRHVRRQTAVVVGAYERVVCENASVVPPRWQCKTPPWSHSIRSVNIIRLRLTVEPPMVFLRQDERRLTIA
ncbi:hypothetical protein [Rhodopirellula baltica]|uniref:hypothetical protein n=1 Tax=Rhodopirellula baltica TaxID=265606 RepID=UPI00032123D8|nr:hypothetical protein [Rhodopirellula baltica]